MRDDERGARGGVDGVIINHLASKFKLTTHIQKVRLLSTSRLRKVVNKGKMLETGSSY
jgi:hypothetical protein